MRKRLRCKQLSPQLQEAIDRYYANRRAANERAKADKTCRCPDCQRWDKKADLDAISAASVHTRHSGIIGFTAMGGLFQFRWQDGRCTYHDEGWDSTDENGILLDTDKKDIMLDQKKWPGKKRAMGHEACTGPEAK